LIQVEPPAPELAAAMGMARAGRKRRRKNGRTCEDCFFHRKMLCALDLDEPCSTFRPNTDDRLAPPRQPALLLRQQALDAEPARI
jgi:hypothetical protein